MDITIKIIRGVAVSNILVLGLAACSSSPAPWTQVDESPWGSKRAMESQSVSGNEVIADTSLNDPVLLADPIAEPVALQEPDAAPAPEVIMPVVVEDLSPEQDIMSMPASYYAVQVYASKTADSVDRFINDKALQGMKTVKTDRSGSIVYVLVDIYPDLATANAAAMEIETRIGSKPWVRSLAGLQNIVAR